MDYQENKKYKIIWLNSFKYELSHIYNYLSRTLKEPSLANKFHNEVFKFISTLSYFPERYQKIFPDKNIRRIPIDKYVILYTVNHNTRANFYLTYFP